MKDGRYKVTITLDYVTTNMEQKVEHAFWQQVINSATRDLTRLVLRGDLSVEEIKEGK